MNLPTKHNIDAINDNLFDQLNRLNTDIEGEELSKEVFRANAMADIAKTIVAAKKVQLDAYKLIKHGEIRPKELDGILTIRN